MDEQRASIQKINAVQVLPLVGAVPRRKARISQSVRVCAKAQRVQQQGFAITFPAIVEKAALGPPAMHNGATLALGPTPVCAAVQCVSQCTQCHFVSSRTPEIGGRREYAGQ